MFTIIHCHTYYLSAIDCSFVYVVYNLNIGRYGTVRVVRFGLGEN